MSFLDKLKNFVETSIKIDLSNFTLININIGAINKAKSGGAISPVEIDKKTQTLKIDLDQLTNIQKQDFKELAKSYVQEGNYLLESDSASLLNKLYDFNKHSSYNKYLTFFKPLIPAEDFEALLASYFMRKEHTEGGDRDKLKRFKSDIQDRYGKRGALIANLCTAGYFEEYLIPIYNNEPSEFQGYYDLLVAKQALTMFIHSRMKKKEIISGLKNKIGLAKKYGLSHFYVHTKGKTNIKTVKNCLVEFEKTYEATQKTERNIEKLDIMVIQFILK